MIAMTNLARRTRSTAITPLGVPAEDGSSYRYRPMAFRARRLCVSPALARAGPGLCLVLVLLARVSVWCAPAHCQSPPSEYEAKAAMLLNFVRFTDWPAEAFASAEAPFVIGVVGKDPFGAALDNTFSGKSVKGRSFVVKRFTADQNLKSCHLLFVPASEKRRQRDLLDKLRGASVLTVGETFDFRDHAGAVQFVLKGSSVGFNINLNVAKAGRLHISSNVLRQADGVWGKYD
jgi:hypothetical protein